MLIQTDQPIQFVPAKPQFPTELQTLRVAIYARVSTQQEIQHNSLKTQVDRYTQMVNENPFWTLVGIYSETGSGKNTKNRVEFNRLIRDVKKKKIDLILTKSISRFSRNNLISFEKLAMLKQLNVNIIFDKERFDLMDISNNIVNTAVLVGFAQAELENKSEDIKWGLKQQAKDGKSALINKKCYGYTHGENGLLIPHPTESKTIKMIFKLRVNGMSLTKIAYTLEKKKILSPTGKEKWGHNAINKILHNEKYIGEVIYQKTYVKDLFEGKQLKNDRDKAMYHHTNHHEPIVDREVFELVQ